MKVLIVRHGIAMDRDDFEGDDDDLRPLTSAGASKMKKNARGLASLMTPSLVVSSPLLRARQTAALLLWTRVAVSEALRPNSKPTSLASYLNDLSLDSVCIVGHEPHLSSFIGWSIESTPIELKKGGACLLDFTGGSVAAGTAKLRWVLTPSLLRRLRV